MKSKTLKKQKKHGGRYASKRQPIIYNSKSRSRSRSRSRTLRVNIINPYNPNRVVTTTSNNTQNGRTGELLNPNDLFSGY